MYHRLCVHMFLVLVFVLCGLVFLMFSVLVFVCGRVSNLLSLHLSFTRSFIYFSVCGFV